MDQTLVWFFIFIATALPAQLLWSRMLKTLREHEISYERWGYHLGALMKYHRFARESHADEGEKRLLWWVYVATAATWAAFLGFLVSGVTRS
jgi:hypothetical protein